MLHHTANLERQRYLIAQRDDARRGYRLRSRLRDYVRDADGHDGADLPSRILLIHV